MGHSYRATGELVRLAVVVLVVRCLPIATHSHDIGKHCAGAVVLVRIKKDAEALELVGGTEDVARSGALLGEPHSEAVAIQIALASDFELEFDLCRVSWEAGGEQEKERTSQFVAVNGTREKIQPSREGLSDARRTYLSVRMMVSPPNSHQRLCMSESRNGCTRSASTPFPTL